MWWGCFIVFASWFVVSYTATANDVTMDIGGVVLISQKKCAPVRLLPSPTAPVEMTGKE
jgi:hypothetical protein